MRMELFVVSIQFLEHSFSIHPTTEETCWESEIIRLLHNTFWNCANWKLMVLSMEMES